MNERKEKMSARKKSFEIILNNGSITAKPYVYKYGLTDNIEIHMSKGCSYVCFISGTTDSAEKMISGKNALVSDALKKVMFLHLLNYGVSLEIKTLSLNVNHVIALEKTCRDEIIVYSMIGMKNHISINNNLKSDSVKKYIITNAKSSYDERFSSLTNLLIAKSKQYYCEKSMYLWMAMNGFYNFIAEVCKKQPYWSKELGLRNEDKKQELLCRIYEINSEIDLKQIGEMKSTDISKKGKTNPTEMGKKTLYGEMFSILKQIKAAPDCLYDQVTNGDANELSEKMKNLSEKYNILMDNYYIMTFWLPYQIRCNYFHSNMPMPLFSFADDGLIRVLSYTNYFVEHFLEEKLPDWFESEIEFVPAFRKIESSYKHMIS